MVPVVPTLKASLENAAIEFAHGVLEAIRHAPIAELAAIHNPAPRALPASVASGAKVITVHAVNDVKSKRDRRTQADIAETLGLIIALLEEHPEGLRTEHIRVKLGIPRAKLHIPLAKGLEAGLLTKSGHKRATVFKVTAHGRG